MVLFVIMDAQLEMFISVPHEGSVYGISPFRRVLCSSVTENAEHFHHFPTSKMGIDFFES